MMTLLEASLPPTIEIKHILKNLYELQQSKQETQTHDEPITTSKPAVVALSNKNEENKNNDDGRRRRRSW
jgi:hypothetical protein